ncbi:M-phase phosphoprotein 8 isoform X2 [Drosophila biarmipes]|uniref:M-phase phosphoprotein 8 isoform X2 n=1 Tax=Drosophila biarmipes TaxID=125945 RepID=UPI0007E5D2ED|nr:M-phase phosphoprotein 8 isoform X2 [Drosophila biarmipes]
MVKLGKKKAVEELSRKRHESRKNGAPPESDHEEKDTGSNGDTGSSVSHSTAASSAKKPPNKRKARQSTATARSASEDSDDLPLNSNGNKVSTSTARASAPKKRRLAKSKANASPAARNGKKSAVVDLEDDVEAAKSDAEPDEEVEYEVEAIVGQKTVKGATYFQVRWKGYTKDEDTWMLEADMSCDYLLKQFRAKEAKTKPSKTPKATKKAGAGGRGRPPGGAKKPTPAPSDPGKEWVVERIVDFVDDAEGGLYRIRWKGFGSKDDTWEPESNLSCQGLIEKFRRDLVTQKNVDTKELRESPQKTKRLINEYYPRTNMHNRIERSSKRAAAKNRVFYGED